MKPQFETSAKIKIENEEQREQMADLLDGLVATMNGHKIREMMLYIKEEHAWMMGRSHVAYAVYKLENGNTERISSFCDSEAEARSVLEDFKKDLQVKTQDRVVHSEEFEVEGE